MRKIGCQNHNINLVNNISLVVISAILLLFPSLSLSSTADIEIIKTITIPTSIKIKGKIVDIARWKDSTGENLVVLSQSGEIKSKVSDCDFCRDSLLYAQQFRKNGNGWMSVWRMQDFEKKCEWDLHVGYFKKSLSITDVDDNGIAEVSFLYMLNCISDVSPERMKLLLYENGKKYSIRGRKILKFGNLRYEGDMKLDKSFNDAPKSFKVFAVDRWKQFNNRPLGAY